MRMDFAPSLLPFDPTDRPGAIKGTPPTKLSGLDLAGIPYKVHKPKVDKAALAPTATGIPGIDAKMLTGDAAAKQHEKLQAYAGQLVSQTFFGTMLKQMRDSPFKSDLFEGGRGGQAFSGLYDQRMVEQMSRGAGKKLVNAIVRKFEAKQAYSKQQIEKTEAADAVTAGAAANVPAMLDTRPAPVVGRADNHPTLSPRNHVAPARRA